MSKFISVHDMLFGCRGGILGGPDDDFSLKLFHLKSQSQ